MGSQCSSSKRGKKEENHPKDNEVFTVVNGAEKLPLLQRGQSLQEHNGAKQMTVDETASSRREEETTSDKLGWSKTRSSLVHDHTTVEVNTPRLCFSETHDPTSASTEEKESEWVERNRAKLIQNVTSVMQIADKMLQQHVIHKEMYANIEAAGTTMDKMRILYRSLTCPSAKSAFFRILQELEPVTCQIQDVIEVMKKHKADLRKRFGYVCEGTDTDPIDEKSLDKVYTELHIIQGESKLVNTEHEIWEIQDKTRSETTVGTKVNCNDIFKSTPNESRSSGQGDVRPVRTVMTKGIAGIGKTVLVKKFILDWVDGKANQKLDFIVVLPFRELNLVTHDRFSIETLVKEFHPELKNIAVAEMFANHRVLFIFDGLDESQLKLNFSTTRRLSDATKEESIDTLVTNLIRTDLLPSALVWITSRPGAVKRIPRKYINHWTEVRGFNEMQKIEYFKRRFKDEAVAKRVIDHILRSRSLLIMCHIPIFCWITAKVLENLLIQKDITQSENITIPTTLTEMYTHFLSVQTQVTAKKYDGQNELDTEEIFKSNEEFIFKLGKMAFEQLEKSNIIFTGHDLRSYGIDVNKAGVLCGLCMEMLKEEHIFNSKKLYCFVHLTVQEYFAALFVYRSFASKKIDSAVLKDFLIKGSEEALKPLLDADPVDLTLGELTEILLANSTQRETGELDMFLRFLIGMSLESTQDLLPGLIPQTEEHSAVVEDIKKSLLEIDLLDCSPERCLNLVHCLIELKDSSVHDTVQRYLKSSHGPDTQLSPVQCSALANSILMSNTPVDEFNLKKYRPSTKGIFRLIPVVRNCRKAIISGVALDSWICQAISSALRMPNSVLIELHLINNTFYDKNTQILTDGLINSQCRLEALSLAGSGLSQSVCEKLASAIKNIIWNIRQLELSGNILEDSLCSVLSVGLRQPKLEKLKLNRNPGNAKICEELVMALTSGLCYLQDLDLSYSMFKDSDMNRLLTGLVSKNCHLQVLSLRHNSLTEKGCETLASVLGSETSQLRELDLSYNDLYDSGVMALGCSLMKQQCGLKSLRLSFCKVTAKGCVSLASAMSLDHCSLRELDLSFNHLTNEGVELLTEIQMDSRCSLEKLNTDHNEDCWFDLKLLRKYACDLTLDPNTAGVNLILSKENKMATYVDEKQPHPDHPARFDTFQVLCEEGLSGRHYWQVECVSVNVDVGVAYRSMKTRGDCSSEYHFGENENSWCWLNGGHFNHNNSLVEFVASPIYSGTIGVYLDWAAGILSFFEALGDSLTHLYTVCTAFTEPLYPAFSLKNGSIDLCKMNN